MNKYEVFLYEAKLRNVFIDYLKNEFKLKFTLKQKGLHGISLKCFPSIAYVDLNILTQKEENEVNNFNRLIKIPIYQKLNSVDFEKIVNSHFREPNNYETREKIKKELSRALAMRYGRNYKRMIEDEIKMLFGVV